MGGRASPRVEGVAQLYVDLAQAHGLEPVHMALAWCRQRPFPCVPIFGATSMGQLNVILDGIDLVLSDELISKIDEIHRANPMPY